MTNAVFYERVSLEVQTKNDAVSIGEQHNDMMMLVERNDWEVTGVFRDTENYRATHPPKRGKIVNPSGERADRPKFLEMLETIRTGKVDVVVCWRDDRLVRHPRVAVALEDALDIADKCRNGSGQVQIYDATGAIIDRFTLSIKAAVWREENKRRAERTRMGKWGSLKDGNWPGEYRRYGYRSVKVEGKRGRAIQLDSETAPIVRVIFEMYDSGKGVTEIRKYLIDVNAPQIYTSMVRHDWSKALIYQVLRSDAYMGKATWTFGDGTEVKIDIPQIITPAMWTRVQKRMDRNKSLSPRNANGVYLLQGLLYCGDCQSQLTVSRMRDYKGGYSYRCYKRSHFPEDNHPIPSCHNGSYLDDAVWREIVDKGLKRPDLVRRQIEARINDLHENAERIDDEISSVHKRLGDIERERAFYQKQAARGKITEIEFDQRMDETVETIQFWNDELVRLKTIRDDASTVKASLDYADALFNKINERLEYLDQSREVLAKMTEEERNSILKERREIIRALVDKVYVNAERQVEVQGVLDGSEAAQFELVDY
jgi:site-specific DNA recombinase